MTKRPSKTGPEPETLSIPGPWEDAVNRALRTPKPESGFPDRPTPKRAPKKKKPPAKRPGKGRA